MPHSANGAKIALLELEGDIDYTTVEPVLTRIADRLDEGRSHVILDMREVTSLSCGALGSLLVKQTDAERAGGSIVIAAARDAVWTTIRSNGFAEVFQVYDTPERAAQSFESGNGGDSRHP
jgi:anti-anti-sigma factor